MSAEAILLPPVRYVTARRSWPNGAGASHKKDTRASSGSGPGLKLREIAEDLQCFA